MALGKESRLRRNATQYAMERTWKDRALPAVVWDKLGLCNDQTLGSLCNTKRRTSARANTRK